MQRKILPWVIAVIILPVTSLLYAEDEISDAERIVGVWVIESPYGRGKVHLEYELKEDGTLRCDKWYLDKKGIPYNRAGSLNNKIDREGSYSFEKNSSGMEVLIVTYYVKKGLTERVVYTYSFDDDDTLKTSSHSGRHQREWKRKKGSFKWR